MTEERFGLTGTSASGSELGSVPVSGLSDPLTFPTGTYAVGEYRFGLPASIGVGGPVGGVTPSLPYGDGVTLEMEPETITVDINFTSSASEDVIISMGREVRLLLIGRLYVDTDPSAAFNQWTSYTFYDKNSMKGADAYYRNVAKLAYTELEVATTGSDANITPDDHTVFSEQNIGKFLDDGELVRIETIGDTMVAEDTVGAHSIDTGLVRVSEFSGLSLFNMENGTLAYLRVEFGSAQTVSLKMELVLIK